MDRMMDVLKMKKNKNASEAEGRVGVNENSKPVGRQRQNHMEKQLRLSCRQETEEKINSEK